MIDPIELKNRISRQSQIILGNFIDSPSIIITKSNNSDIEKATKTVLDKKMKKVMDEFTAGTLKSSSGEVVTDKKQALAIAYSEAEEYSKGFEGTVDKKLVKKCMESLVLESK